MKNVIGLKLENIFYPKLANLLTGTGTDRTIASLNDPIFKGLLQMPAYYTVPKTGLGIFNVGKFSKEILHEAVNMNKNAMKQARIGNVVNYPKATVQDLKRLTSETIEDSYSRCKWTNPKDGKVYNLLKQGETKDGKIQVCVLDSEGQYVKDIELEPKTIAIIDWFSGTRSIIPQPDKSYYHGDIVKIFAQRNNPFAKIIPVNGSAFGRMSQSRLLNEFKEVDYINASWGVASTKKEFNAYRSPIKDSALYDSETRNLLFLKALCPNIRIFNASGNKSKGSVTESLAIDIE